MNENDIKPYLVLKYYHYVPIEDVAAFRQKHHLYCIRHNLRGRIKIAPEGINGTLSGHVTDCEKYIKYLQKDPRFKGIQFNVTRSSHHVHQKLHVRLKKEIIRADIASHIDERTHQHGKEYIDARTFEAMRQRDDVVILDVRSNYEHQLGKFKNAFTFDIDNFRSFFSKAADIDFDKRKKYIVICTRGIKSVKGWQYLKQVRKLPHVHYLQGGILDYAQKTNGCGFDGVCYVFDKRIVVPINKKTKPIAACRHCKQPCQRMVNCANPSCNAHLPMCESCSIQLDGGCSQTCRKNPSKRPYNGIGYYVKQPNGYNPYIGLYRKIDTCQPQAEKK